MKTKQKITIIVTLLLVAFSFYIRFRWSMVSQWREDQGSNLWVGYVYPLTQMPIAFVNSIGFPHPNGMAMIGKIISFAPNIYLSTLVYSMMHFFVTLGFIFSFSRWSQISSTLTGAVLLTSTVLTGLSVELQQSFFYIPLNLLFGTLLFSYLHRPTVWKLSFMGSLAILSPIFSFLGAVNSITFSVITLFAFLYKKPNASLKNWVAPSLFLTLTLAFCIFFTWMPYFQVVSLSEVQSPEAVSLFQRLKRVGGGVLYFYEWISYFTSVQLPPLLVTSNSLMTDFSKSAAFFQSTIHKALNLTLVLGLIAFFIKRPKLSSLSRSEKAFFILLGWLIIALGANSMLGNYRWHRGERIDQSVQLFPILLTALLSQNVLLMRWNKIYPVANKLLVATSCLFIGMNMFMSHLLIRDVLNYRGQTITEADVPLRDKQQVAEFIVTDMKNKNTSLTCAPISYHLEGPWAWQSGLNKILAKYYTPAFYKGGLAINYEILRRFGIKNCENDQPLYWVSYSVEPIPSEAKSFTEHTLVGGLRVSIK